MFSTWDLVRPRFWYPMSSLEQSMMDLEHISDLMSRSRFPFDRRSGMLAVPSNFDDDDFFKDLPVLAREQRPATQHREESVQSANIDSKKHDHSSNDRDNDPNQQTKHHTVASKDEQPRRAFSSYTYSNSSIVDDKGRRVMSTRRRYEDSTGRLKAVHERQVEGKKLCTTWSRKGHDDKGEHEAICSSGTPDDFEALWQETPFGEAQKKTIKQQQQQQLEQDKHPTKSKSSAEANATPI